MLPYVLVVVEAGWSCSSLFLGDRARAASKESRALPLTINTPNLSSEPAQEGYEDADATVYPDDVNGGMWLATGAGVRGETLNEKCGFGCS